MHMPKPIFIKGPFAEQLENSLNKDPATIASKQAQLRQGRELVKIVEKNGQNWADKQHSD